MSSQLPAPANPAHISVHLRRLIRRGSLVRRQYFDPQTPPLSYSYSTLRLSDQLSNYEKNKNLSSMIFQSCQSSLRSRSVKYSSKLLVNPSLAAIIVPGADPWRVQAQSLLVIGRWHSNSLQIRSMEISSAEFINLFFDFVCIQSLSKVPINSLFIILSRSRSAKSLSAELVLAISSPQWRTRNKKQSIPPIPDFALEKSQRRVSDLKNRVGELRSEIKAAIANEAKQIKESMKRKRFRGTVTEIDPPPPKFAVKKHLRSKLPWRIRIHFSPVLCSLFIERFALVWLDTTKLLSDVYCRLMCMLLNPYNQTNHPECKSHPDSGLSAIAKLDPGYIIAQLSSVWKEWIKWCIEFGVDAHAITAVQYDWRLQPSKLEERDLYFHKLKLSLLTFETSLKHHGGQQIVFAHSLGVEDLGGMVELVEGSVVDLDGIDVTKVGVAVYAEFCRDWGEALRMYDDACHVLRDIVCTSTRLPPIQCVVEIKTIAKQLNFNWLASNFKKDEGSNQIYFAPMHWRKAASYGYSKLKDLEHCIMFCVFMHQKMWSCWSKILKVK